MHHLGLQLVLVLLLVLQAEAVHEVLQHSIEMICQIDSTHRTNKWRGMGITGREAYHTITCHARMHDTITCYAMHVEEHRAISISAWRQFAFIMFQACISIDPSQILSGEEASLCIASCGSALMVSLMNLTQRCNVSNASYEHNATIICMHTASFHPII